MPAAETPKDGEIHQPAGALAVLLENHAFVLNMGRLDDLPDETVVPWFYRTLRNAAIDHYRRQTL